MKDNAPPLISIPGWRNEIAKGTGLPYEITSWEKRLDAHFTEVINSDCLLIRAGCGEEDWPDSVSWRQLVGMRLLELDIGLLRHSLDPINRARMLPAICMSLAIWGIDLQGFGEDLELYLLPNDNEFIADNLTGFYGENTEDELFYECLNTLNQEQRACIAEFIEYYFIIYSGSFSWFTEKDKAAAEALVRVWRGEK